MRRIFISFIFVIILSSAVSSAPSISSISGTLDDGNVITVNGAGFGQKSPAEPLKFDDFEEGSAGDRLSGWEFSTSDGRPPVYSSEFTRPNSQRSAKALFDDNQYLSSFGVIDMSNGFESVYIDAWYLYDPASPPSRNHKLFRLYAEANQGAPNFYVNVYCNPGSMSIESDGLSGDFADDWIGWSWSMADKKWVHLQGYFETSSQGVVDGYNWFATDGQVYVDSPWKYREAGHDIWHSVWFGNYLGHDAAAGCPESPGASYTFWDDVYVDRSRARVELCDAGRSHCETQLPTDSWTSGSLSFKVNLGSFGSGDDLYLFVVDSSGGVSPGYGPLQAGHQGGGDPTASCGAGDADCDGKVGLGDLILIGANWGRADFDPRADLSGDGEIGLADLIIIGANFGKVY